MAGKDFYELLGITIKARPREVKAAYRALARKYHPDIGEVKEDDALFREITEAYQTLSDPDKRNDYNKERGYEHFVPLDDDDSFEDQPKEEESSSVNLDSQIGEDEQFWNRLRAKQAEEHDLKVDQKIAMNKDSEETEEEDPDDDYITPWGDDGEGDVDVGRSSGKLGVLGIFGRKGRKQKGISKQELKKRLDEASQPLKPQMESPPAQEMARPAEPVEAERNASSGRAFREERVFNFYITPLECATGTEREIALSGRDDEQPRRIPVKIPAGVKDNMVLEVARGWERAKVCVRLAEDPFVSLDENNVVYLLPITLGEAVKGISWDVPTVSGNRKIQIERGKSATESICLDACGILDKETGIRGNFFVQPIILPPHNITETVKAAAKSLDEFYTSSVRGDLEKNKTESRCFFRRGGQTVCRFPLTVSEALDEFSVSIPSGKGQVSVDISPNWKVDNQVLFEGQGIGTKTDGTSMDLLAWPYISLPDSLTDEVKFAIEAIEMHYQRDIRADLPKKKL